MKYIALYSIEQRESERESRLVNGRIRELNMSIVKSKQHKIAQLKAKHARCASLALSLYGFAIARLASVHMSAVVAPVSELVFVSDRRGGVVGGGVGGDGRFDTAISGDDGLGSGVMPDFTSIVSKISLTDMRCSSTPPRLSNICREKNDPGQRPNHHQVRRTKPHFGV